MDEKYVGDIVKYTLTSAPYTMYQLVLIAYLFTGNAVYGTFFILAMIFGQGANQLEKRIFKKIWENNIGSRPSGCGTKTEQNCTGCSFFPFPGKVSETWGMPSGHVQIMALGATFFTLYFIGKDPKDKHLKTKIAILWAITLAVTVQRVYSKCHSKLQVVAGAGFGIGFGILSYFIARKVKKDSFPKSLFIK